MQASPVAEGINQSMLTNGEAGLISTPRGTATDLLVNDRSQVWKSKRFKILLRGKAHWGSSVGTRSEGTEGHAWKVLPTGQAKRCEGKDEHAASAEHGSPPEPCSPMQQPWLHAAFDIYFLSVQMCEHVCGGLSALSQAQSTPPQHTPPLFLIQGLS